MSEQNEVSVTNVTKSKGPAPILVIFTVLPLLGILVALLVVASDLTQQNNSAMPDLQRSSNGLLNRAAPDFELTRLDGSTIRLSELQGQTVFLNFWQTTCAPCVHELPDFVDFEADNAGRVSVLTVNFDETSTQVRDFLASNDIVGVKVALDLDGTIRRTYSVLGLPTTFVINADGQVRFINIGPLTPEDMQELLELTESTDPT